MNYPNCKNIKDIRKLNNFNQAHMAYILGVGIRKYRDMERGYLCFSQFNMIKMMLLFQLDNEDIYNLFFSKENNQYLYIASNLISFDRDAFLNDFKRFAQKGNPLFCPWKKYNVKSSGKKTIANEKR